MVVNDEPEAKKQKVFSVEEFRENLHGGNKISHLQHFLKLCIQKKHDHISEYLQKGGSCTELLRLIEYDSNVPPVLILEIVCYVLLQIVGKLPQFHASGHETCRLLLSHHLPMINKMLGLNSRVAERRVVLKLLTTIVSFSAGLAKDVLVHVDFNATNLQILSKHTEERDGVRTALVNFLSAFLVDGHYPTISALLGKPGLLTSVISGLVFDVADSVCVMLTAMKNHILENPSVTKTMKMKVFSTHVIRDIVNLYNWKGPKGFGTKKNNATVHVDQLEKSKVNDCVHNFLLILCTTKHGIIFRDNQLGLGKASQNNLLLTVVKSLERPWEHSYAGELLVKMCGACPDIVRTIWSNLKEYLTPRNAENWFKAMKFAENLIFALGPEKIEKSVGILSVQQLVHATQSLVAPSTVVQSIKCDNFETLSLDVKLSIHKLLLVILDALEKYTETMKKLLDNQSYLTYNRSISEHVLNTFPTVNLILNFKNLDQNNIDFLSLTVNLLSQYNKFSPQLLDDLQQIKIKNLLDLLSNISKDNNSIIKQSYEVQTKIIDLSLKLDPSNFYPNSELFPDTLSSLLEAYHFLKDTKTYETIRKVLVNTSIFENCEYEIGIWTDSIFNSKKCSRDLKQFIVRTIQMAAQNSIEYTTKMTEIKKGLSHEVFDLKRILENLDEEKSYRNSVKHKNLSHLILALIDCLGNFELTKSIKNYVSYVLINLLHQQTNPDLLLTIIKTGDVKAPKSVLEYLLNFENMSSENILDIEKNNLDYLSKFSKAFLTDNQLFDDNFFKNTFETFNDNIIQSILKLDILHMLIFNISNLTSKNVLTNIHAENLLKYINYSNNNQEYISIILKNPNFLENFSLLKVTKESSNTKYFIITSLITELVKNKSGNYDHLLDSYRLKTFNDCVKIIQKAKYKNFEPEPILNIVKSFGLSQGESYEFLNKVIRVNVNDFVTDSKNLSIIYHLTSYILNQLFVESGNYENIDKFMLNDDAIGYLVDVLIFLLSSFNFDTTALVTPFINYLKLFPHLIKGVDKLFLTLSLKQEFWKENSSLLCLLLEQNNELLHLLIENIEEINFTKGIVIPILDVCVKKKMSEELVKIIYDKFEPILLKGLEKPQKAGQYFERYYASIGEIMRLFCTSEKCKIFMQKVVKYEISEPFLGYLLKIIYQKEVKNQKFINNSILTFIGVLINIFKKKVFEKLDDNVRYFKEYLDAVFENTKEVDYSQTISNENFKLFVKFSLKFGISGRHDLLSLISAVIKNMNIPEGDLKDTMEMITSHSEFLDLVLEGNTRAKTELLRLMLEVFKRCEDLMETNYVPLMLAAYGATTSESDRIILSLLKIFEANPNKTSFYDFKPFLWGRAAANHYSVKSDIQKALMRQPRTGTILDLLELDTVLNTIKYFPLDLELRSERLSYETTSERPVYDLSFLLPLFTTLLSSENKVQTYRFTKSGALSLTVLALTSDDEDVRGASCFVLSRFYSHVECRHSGKDNLLWLRFVEAICKGVGVLESFKLNSFVGIFLAKMALILTNPNHVMYGPLSQYLTAKSIPDFKSIPELYTLLHSSDVNYREHRRFILELLLDGMKTKSDFEVALNSVSFKLVTENYNSCLSDKEEKTLILKIIRSATKITLGTILLCDNYGLLSWLNSAVQSVKFPQNDLLSIILDIISNIVKIKEDCAQITEMLLYIIDKISSLKEENVLKLLKILNSRKANQLILTEERLRNIINVVGDKECLYNLDYKQGSLGLETTENVHYYLKCLTLKLISVTI